MPKEIADKLIWLFLLAPGFISVTIVGTIIDLGQLTEFQVTYYSFVLTAFDLVVGLGLIYVWKIGRKIRTGSAPSWTVSQILVMGMLTSVMSGVTLGLAAERDWFFVTLRSLPITDTLNKRSSSRPVAFLLSQNTSGRLKNEGDARPDKVTEAWVRITLNDGTQYEGWPEFYGIDKEKSEIYLSPACEARGKASRVVEKIPGPGVIVYENELKSITFLDRQHSPCFSKWFANAAKPTARDNREKQKGR